MRRYNEPGQWRPFIKGGDESFAQSAAQQLAGEDEGLFAPLFYVFYTGFKVFEFVVCTSVELPTQEATFLNGKLNLWKCPRVYPIQNEVVYDGWWPLSGPEPEEISTATRSISQVVNRIAFTFKSSVHWKQKYNHIDRTGGFATPTEVDLPLLERILSPLGSDEELAVLDSAIDWCNRARSASNIFTQFLGYYIAVESTAIAVAEGTAQFDLEIARPTASVRRQARLDCIREAHERLFSSDPAEFVRVAYFDCIGSLKSQVTRVLRAVFGEESQFVAAIVGQNASRKSLMTLRSEIAHGHYSMSNHDHRTEVFLRVGEMSEIARQFIARLLLRLNSSDPIPGWSGRHIAGISFDNPNGLWMADRNTVEAKNWSIRPEWCY